MNRNNTILIYQGCGQKKLMTEANFHEKPMTEGISPWLSSLSTVLTVFMMTKEKQQKQKK